MDGETKNRCQRIRLQTSLIHLIILLVLLVGGTVAILQALQIRGAVADLVEDGAGQGELGEVAGEVALFRRAFDLSAIRYERGRHSQRGGAEANALIDASQRLVGSLGDAQGLAHAEVSEHLRDVESGMQAYTENHADLTRAAAVEQLAAKWVKADRELKQMRQAALDEGDVMALYHADDARLALLQIHGAMTDARVDTEVSELRPVVDGHYKNLQTALAGLEQASQGADRLALLEEVRSALAGYHETLMASFPRYEETQKLFEVSRDDLGPAMQAAAWEALASAGARFEMEGERVLQTAYRWELILLAAFGSAVAAVAASALIVRTALAREV